ncbi:MAG: FAD-dependent oxidoreductase [Roseiarcus sp.]|jgi:squalene-associated FAD-dependent desaturase
MMRRPTVHVIGAGFSGLSAAVHLATTSAADIVVHESAAQAGGRRRSFFDDATAITVDGGDGLVLSSWRSAMAAIEAIGARPQWREVAPEGIAFADMASGERWTLRPNAGPVPWWVFDSRRRAPQTRLRDYWPAARLGRAPANALLHDYVPNAGPAAERLWRPFALAALNTDLNRASARLAGAALREMRFGGARPLTPIHGLARAFVEPALKTLRRRGVAIRFERRLAALDLSGERVAGLEFDYDRVDLAPGDAVILATPSRVAAGLVPGLSAPQEFNGAIFAYFAISPPPGAPAILGAVNGAFNWMSCGDGRISVAIKDAGALMERPREELAADLWRNVAALTGLSDATPAWRVVKQKRATFAATPHEDALRPSCETPWRNFFLAGAYVQNGLPDTLEGTVRSGAAAAERAMKRLDAQ